MNNRKNLMFAGVLADVFLSAASMGIQYASAEYLANGKTVTTFKNQQVTFLLSGSAPQDFFYQVQQTTSNGEIIFDGTTGQIWYTPNVNYTGTDSFTFRTVAAANTNWFGESAIVTINVLASNPSDNGSHTSPEQNQGNTNQGNNNNSGNNDNNNSPPSSPSTVVTPLFNGGDNNWKMFYEPIEKELKKSVGKDIPEASQPYDKFHNGNRAYIEYVHFDELTERYGALKMSELTELQKAWLFAEIKPTIDGAFMWIK